jgi:hypothetical protein
MRRPVLSSWVFGLCLFLAILAIPSHALASISLQVTSPMANQAEGASLSVSVSVSSTYAVTSVSAQSGSVSAALTAPSAAGQPWTGTLAIGNLPFGAASLTVTATDALDNTGSTTVSYVHHNPPAIQVTSPVNGSVAHPSLTLAATCSDDVGCLQPNMQPGFEVWVGPEDQGQLFTTSGNTLNQTVDLTAYDGQQVSITFTALNADEQTTTISEIIYVDASPQLVEVESAPGTILDFDPTRLLYEALDNSLVIRNRQTQAETTIGTPSLGGANPQSGSLTSVGAVWFSNDPSSACLEGSTSIWYWNGGAATQFGPMPDCTPPPAGAVIAGDWALLPMTGAPVGSTLTLQTLDLVTGVTTDHPFTIGAGDLAASTITTAGDLFVIAGGNSGDPVLRDHGGTVDTLGTVDSPATGVLTDGVNLVLGVANPVDGGYWIDQFSIDGGTQTLLAPSAAPASEPPPPGTMFQANNGWIAYVQASVGVNQVWSLSPTGTKAEVSIFNSNSTIDTLGPTGQVMFMNNGDDDAGVAVGRYLGAALELPQRVSSMLGRSVEGCDGWYVVIGGSLFRVAGTENAGTGCPAVDGGAVSEAGNNGIDGGFVDATAVDAAGGGGIEAGSGGEDASGSGGDARGSVDAPGSGGSSTDASKGEDSSAGGPSSETGGGGDASGGGCAVAFGGGDGVSPWPMAIAALGAMMSARRIRRKRSLR